LKEVTINKNMPLSTKSVTVLHSTQSIDFPRLNFHDETLIKKLVYVINTAALMYLYYIKECIIWGFKKHMKQKCIYLDVLEI
jgi:hypothetical protein